MPEKHPSKKAKPPEPLWHRLPTGGPNINRNDEVFRGEPKEKSQPKTAMDATR